MGNARKVIFKITVFISIVFLSTACNDDMTIEWHMVDVNFHNDLQGDAHLILDSGKVVLIDAGYGGLIGDKLTSYILELGVKKIDKFIISHPHRDHYEGIRNVIGAGIKVDSVYYNKNVSMSDCCFKEDHFNHFIAMLEDQGATINDVEQGQIIKAGTTEFKILFAAKGYRINDKKIDMNDASIVMMWNALDHRVLFTGDLNAVSGKHLSVNMTEGIKADILKVPHHGATGIAPREFFETVSPEVLMFPDPKWVRSSPRGEIAFGYAKQNRKSSCSNSENGTVIIKIEKSVVTSIPEKPSESCKGGVIIEGLI